jgi:hypothetical protein
VSPLSSDERAQLDRLLDSFLPPVVQTGPKLIVVTAGSDLQAAYDAAPDGAEIVVEPGEYAGLDAKRGNVTVRTSANLPEGRVDGSMAAGFVKLRGTIDHSAIVIRPGVHAVRFHGLQPLPGADASIAMCAVGDDHTVDYALAPQDIVFDQMLLVADSVRGGKRGFALHGGRVAILNSHVGGFRWKDDDSQAIAAWAGPVEADVLNNFLEASGENLIVGGGDEWAEIMRPRSLVAKGNTCTKDLAWRARTDVAVKNCFELKSILKAEVTGNIFEHAWKDRQEGAAVLFTPRNQDGRAPYTTVENVLFHGNVIRHCAAGFQIQGDDNEKPSGRLVNLQILNNLLYDIDPKTWNHPTKGSGSGRLIQITRGPLNVEIARNTMLGSRLNSFLTLDGPQKADRLNVHDNVFAEGAYGIKATGEGAAAWAQWTELSSVFAQNLIARQVLPTVRVVKYPLNNVLSEVNEAVTDTAFNVMPRYARAGLGCDLSGLQAF